MIINHNLSAMFASRQLGISDGNQAKDIEKLSSGFRINRAGDDAAGLAVSEKMRSQVRGLNQAAKNTMDGISFIQTTEGYLEATTEALQRIRELAVQGATGIYSSEDRAALQAETKQLVQEIDRIASQGQFNGLNMLTGRFGVQTQGDATANTNPATASEPLYIHVGANMDQRIQINVGTMTAKALGVVDKQSGESITLETAEKSNIAIGTVDEALKKVNGERANLGALQNRLEKAYRATNNSAENLQAAESRIRDEDMASRMVDYTKNTILIQTANAMLANSNQKSQSVLQLLR
jgi:flagellin